MGSEPPSPFSISGRTRPGPFFFLLVWCALCLGCATPGTQEDGQKFTQSTARQNSQTTVAQREMEARLDLADAYLRNRQPRMALRELQHIQTQAADLPRFTYTLGYTQFTLGNEAAAVKALTHTLTLDPDHAEAWNTLGLARLAQNDLDAAQQAFVHALRIPTYRTPEVAALNLAQLYLERDDPDMAEKYAQAALELNWRFSKAYLVAARIKAGQGALDQATDLLEQGLAADLDNVELILPLVEYLHLDGQNARARDWLDRLLENSDPGSDNAALALEYKNAWSSRDRDIEPTPATPPRTATISPENLEPGQEPRFFTIGKHRRPEDSLPAADEDLFIAQVGGFLKAHQAEALRDSCLEQGYAARIHEIDDKGKQWYLVSIAREDHREMARIMAELFEQDTGKQAVVKRIGGGRYLDMPSLE
jgi:Tfp pilus assembly protein PilF